MRVNFALRSVARSGMTPPQPARARWPFALTFCVVAAFALLPWLHNHGYLRDLYDYGIVIAADARIDAGQRPYRDFTTPIQAGFATICCLAPAPSGNN